ncbi:MAG: type II secretion system F family protein [Candidatus Omnitrophota bacterium]|jgi:tight adherence protein C
MELLIISTLLFSSCGLLAYQLSARKLIEEVHLPPEIKGHSGLRASGAKGILGLPIQLFERLIEKADIPLDNLRKKLISAGRPMNATQFLAVKFSLMAILPFAVFIILQPQPPVLFLAVCIGFFFPEFWLNGKVKKRQAAVLRDLPHVIDLLNICVGAGLDFMVAVNRVIQEFHPCTLVEELRVLVQEIHMGSSRRESLKNLSNRINSPEVVSFVRTLLQADRMGTPISDALKMQSEEIRIRRFQKGEEMALKAPIKLLFPLLVFILPVVMIIVAGPILIQFTRGGFLKF